MAERLKKKGDLVQYWYNTGAFGYQIAYAVVIKAGPKTYTVQFRSGNRNRVRQESPELKLITDPELLAEALKELKEYL